MDTSKPEPAPNGNDASASRDRNAADSSSSSAGPLSSDHPGAMDPAVLIALAVRFGIMGRVCRQGVPANVREGLRHHASLGEPACTMVLGWLDDLVLSDLDAVTASRAHRSL